MRSHRLYSFVNHIYMSPLQWGIQTGHAAVAMMARALAGPPCLAAPFLEWNQAGPTKLVLQGGNVARLLSHEARLGELCAHLGLPFSSFREDDESLGGIITCVALLLPEELFLLEQVVDQSGYSFFCRPSDETRGDAGGSLDFSTIPGGLPVSEQSNPELHELLVFIKAARLAGT